MQGLRDIKPILPLTESIWQLLALVLGGLLLMFLLYKLFLFFKNRKQKSKEVEKIVLPHEWAQEALGKLKSAYGFDWDVADVSVRKKYYFQINEIFRMYLQKRFDFQATDLTTDEILPIIKSKIKREFHYRSEYFSLSKDFLTQTDLIKFTDLIPTQDEPQKLWRVASEFVTRTKKIPSQMEAHD